jgi:DNA/RNA-binding domain of Phe-tRNA-synthetase-like protein
VTAREPGSDPRDDEIAFSMEVDATPGWISEEVAGEFPGLVLQALTLDARPGRSPAEIKQRLRGMSDRFRGAQAVTMRQDPIPWAYRVFYRHVGLDPDADRTPVEAAAVERLLKGQYASKNILDDALTIALVETGVPVWALDAENVDGPLGVRLTAPGELMGRSPEALPVPDGQMVVADSRSPLGLLFGHPAEGHGVTATTTRMTLFALQVSGVPAIHVEEALWTCISVLRAR